ncbi:DUF4347 domain-containing protein, partial [Nitrosomonas sp. JL21]|uniref:DUF4347 domain-containing protein n=1 Tax=Nitrosomonas sp. JL21 TaxID=153949 RepID=UPI00137041DB
MNPRTIFVDTHIANYQAIVERYDARSTNLVYLSNPRTDSFLIQEYIAAHHLDQADINLITASKNLNGLITDRIIFVDPGVADYQSLIAHTGTSATIVVLDAHTDGVGQIHGYLTNTTGSISTVDIVSHGDAGVLYLGSTALSSDNIAQYEDELSNIGHQLAQNANILLYGCYVAAGQAGQRFIDRLAELIGADVAASTNLTGAAALGGDWVLEAVNMGGEVRAGALQIPAYQGALVSITGNSWNNPATYTEQSAATRIDTNVSINSWNNGTNTSLTISVASAHAGDQLTVLSTSGNNQISVSGSNIIYTSGFGSGTPAIIGTINSTNNGINGKSLVINLNNNTATNSNAVQALARALQFANTSDAPPSGNRAITLTLDDTSGGTVSSSGASVTITPVNDTPAATNLNSAETYTENTPLNLIDIVASDPDSANITATLTLSNAAAGALSTATSGAVTSTYNAATGVWVASGAVANVNALLAGVTFTPAANSTSSFTITTNISDGSLSVSGTKNMTGAEVNDAPTATNLNAAETYTEDTPLNLIDVVASDVDSAIITATLTLSNAAAGNLSTATSGAVTSTFNAATGVWVASGAVEDVNALLAEVTFTPAADFNGDFTIATNINDGSLSVSGTKSMTGTAVNDAPTATNLDAAENYIEDIPLNLTDIVASDIDSSTITVTLTLSNVAAGSLSTASSGAVTSTYNAGTGVWEASGAVADVNALLAGVTFTPAANFSSNFTIATNVSDGTLNISGIKNMTGTAVNHAPTGSATAVLPAGTEDVNYTIDSADLLQGFSDPDSDVLQVADLSADHGTVVDNGDGTFTISHTVDYNGPVSLHYNVVDGNGGSVAGSQSYSLTAVNDLIVSDTRINTYT